MSTRWIVIPWGICPHGLQRVDVLITEDRIELRQKRLTRRDLLRVVFLEGWISLRGAREINRVNCRHARRLKHFVIGD